MKKYCSNCIYETLPNKEVTLKESDILFLETDTLEYVYKIVEGLIKITKLHQSGDEKVFDILGPNDYVALLAVLQGDEEYIATATALTDVTVRRFSKKDVEQAYSSNAMFQTNCMKCVVTRSKTFHNYLFNVSNVDPEEKILSVLQLLANKFGRVENDIVYVTLPFSKTVLANIIGVRRETLSRKLSSMKKDNILEENHNVYKFNRL
jgi:CRP/FNR family transcriptional regulator